MGVGNIDINELRERHYASAERKMAIMGNRYYRSQNDITKRKMYFYSEAGLTQDPYRANNKISSAYYKMLVDQKINYLLGNYPKVEIPDDDFWYKLKGIATNAAKKGIEWAQPYIQDGEFKLATVPAEELMPIWDNNKLVKMYRFYEKDDKNYCKEYTDTEEITYVGNEEIERTGHLTEVITEGAVVRRQAISWGRVPFIPLMNNETATYDLEPVKHHIDAMDIVLSDFANNLEDFQDVTWILKGYDGTSVDKFINDVKLYKSIVVGEGGDAQTHTTEIPFQARKEMMETLERMIFKFGFGLNMDSLTGGSLTNVNIQAQFANLEMKCNSFAQEVTKFIDQYIEFYNIYAKMNGKAQIPPQEVVYDKTTMVNALEQAQVEATQIEALIKTQGVVSRQTIREELPIEIDEQEEIKRLEEEQGEIKLENEMTEE